MPAYVYRARDPGGQLQRGRADADSERDLILRLRNQGFLVLGVERDRDLQALMQQQGGLFARKISGKELAIFIRQFATMVNAGLPVVTALRVLSKQTTNQRLQRILVQITADVEAGENLATAFGRHPDAFPMIMIQMISAGEVGGILDDVCLRLADQLEKQEQIRQKVRSALVYPSIVSTVAVLVVIFLVTFVVPRFVDVYADFGAELPAPTKVLIAVSHFMAHAWWIVIGAMIGGFVGVRKWFSTESGASIRDQVLLKLPVFGPMVAKDSIGRFARTLSSLLASGITILKALAVVEKTVGNRVIGAAIREAAEDVRQGQSLVVPLRRTHVFPPMVLEMTSVGEETGTVEEMLAKVADFYESEVERMAERLSSTLEPLIMLGLAMVVGAIVASMMLPIFNLWTVI